MLGVLFLQCVPLSSARRIIMLAPAGDAQHVGRAIGDTFERGLTLQCAHYLQTHIQERMPTITVVLHENTGKKTEPLEYAQIANRLKVDLYISLHFYHDEDALTLNLYHYLQHPVTDVWNTRQHGSIALIPYDQAHKQMAPTTHTIIKQLRTLLNEQQARTFFVPAPIGFPFKPLVGIQAPAIGIEMSLQQKEQWQIYAATITEALITMLTKICNETYSS